MRYSADNQDLAKIWQFKSRIDLGNKVKITKI